MWRGAARPLRIYTASGDVWKPFIQPPFGVPSPASSTSGVAGSRVSVVGFTAGMRDAGWPASFTCSASPTVTYPMRGFIQMPSCQARYIFGFQNFSS